MKRRLRWLTVGAVTPPLIWLALSALAGDDRASAVADRGELVLGVEVSGTLRAVSSEILGPPAVPNIWRFKISMMAPEGERIEAGQPVLAFDTSELAQRLRSARAELASAQAEVAKQEIDLRVRKADDALAIARSDASLRLARMNAQPPGELFSSIEIEKAGLDLELAELEVAGVRRRIEASQRASLKRLEMLRSDVDRYRAAVAHLEDAIARMTRLAPRAGLVVYVMRRWSGDKKKVGDTCWVADRVIEIPDLEFMECDGEVEEAVVGRVRVGQRVTLRLDAHPDVEHTGSVKSLSRAIQVRSWRNPVKVARVVIGLDATDAELMRPGMRFRGIIETLVIEDVITIPIESVRLTPEGPVVDVRRFASWQATPVRLGQFNRERVQVLDGIEEGHRVALGGETR